MTHDDPDLPLVHRARQGDFAAFESLVARHGPRLYRLALRIVARQQDAEEVVQQTFLSVLEHLKEFREEAQFSTWLMRIATNHGLALLRKRSRQRTVPFDDVSEEGYEGLPHPEYIAQWRETPEQIASRHETRELVDRALDELDDKYRLVFVLRDVEGLSTAEAADALGISEANVKVRLLRARLMLRERLTRAFGDDATRVTPGHDHEHSLRSSTEGP
jgi:RNA polymerase sigma-70 factor, ECF subfamily